MRTVRAVQAWYSAMAGSDHWRSVSMEIGPLFLGALAIAVVALADTMSTASSFAARRGERVHGNQEMIGIGAANLAAGLFQGFPVSTSGSRTAVAEQAGSRSQVTGLVGAAVITVVLRLRAPA